MSKLSQKGDVLTPNIKQVFKLFYECPYNDLKVVLIGQDPYTSENEADGLAFSCGNTDTNSPEQITMFDEIRDTVYENEKWYSFDPDLTRWSNQGVLLLNVALTTEVGKIGAHYDIWRSFVVYLINKLAELNTGLVYIFVGDVAKEWANKIPESNHKFYCYHPMSACHNDGIWESNDVFRRTNQILEANNGTKITW